MYILKSIYDYPDILNIVSETCGILEEIALSLFEEDMYEWFCIIHDQDYPNIDLKEVIKEAKIHAFDMSFMYDIEDAVEVRDPFNGSYKPSYA